MMGALALVSIVATEAAARLAREQNRVLPMECIDHVPLEVIR